MRIVDKNEKESARLSSTFLPHRAGMLIEECMHDAFFFFQKTPGSYNREVYDKKFYIHGRFLKKLIFAKVMKLELLITFLG